MDIFHSLRLSLVPDKDTNSLLRHAINSSGETSQSSLEKTPLHSFRVLNTQTPLSSSSSSSRQQYGALPLISFVETQVQPAVQIDSLTHTEEGSALSSATPNIPKLNITHVNNSRVPRRNSDSAIPLLEYPYQEIPDTPQEKDMDNPQDRSLYYLPNNSGHTSRPSHVFKEAPAEEVHPIPNYGTFDCMNRFIPASNYFDPVTHISLHAQLEGNQSYTDKLTRDYENNPKQLIAQSIARKKQIRVQLLETWLSKIPSLPEFTEQRNHLATELQHVKQECLAWSFEPLCKNAQKTIIESESVLSLSPAPCNMIALVKDSNAIATQMRITERITEEISTAFDRLEELQPTIEKWNIPNIYPLERKNKIIEEHSILRAHLHFLKIYLKAKTLSLSALSLFSSALEIQESHHTNLSEELNALTACWQNTFSESYKATQAWRALEIHLQRMPAAVETKLLQKPLSIINAKKIGIILEKIASAYALIAEKKAQRLTAREAEIFSLTEEIVTLSRNITSLFEQWTKLEN